MYSQCFCFTCARIALQIYSDNATITKDSNMDLWYTKYTPVLVEPSRLPRNRLRFRKWITCDPPLRWTANIALPWPDFYRLPRVRWVRSAKDKRRCIRNISLALTRKIPKTNHTLARPKRRINNNAMDWWVHFITIIIQNTAPYALKWRFACSIHYKVISLDFNAKLLKLNTPCVAVTFGQPALWIRDRNILGNLGQYCDCWSLLVFFCRCQNLSTNLS